MTLISRYREAVAGGALASDPAQEDAAARLQALADALGSYRRGAWWRRRASPRGLYLWGDVGRGKSMLMDLFFAAAPVAARRRIHFNAFMAEVHARIHALRDEQNAIPRIAGEIARDATLLCFDEFQVNDVADAMILGRLFEQLFAQGVVIVATSNTPPGRLYEGGINRQLFLPFIAEIERHLDVIELAGHHDHRLDHGLDHGLTAYVAPLGPQADAAMDGAWRRLTGGERGEPMRIPVLGRELRVPQAAQGVARFSFAQLCVEPLAGPDYLALAHAFHTLIMDGIPALAPAQRNEARRFTLLIDTLYDEGVKLVCSAAVPPDALYPEGDGADAFRRTASRLIEMQSEDYLERGAHA